MGSRSSQSRSWCASKIRKLKRHIRRKQKELRRLQASQQAPARSKREKEEWLRKFVKQGATNAEGIGSKQV